MCRDWAISIRRACGALNFDHSTYHYTSRRADQAGLERRIREICETRVRYGYRRVHVLLEREGWGTNIKRTYRIYRDLGLQLRNKTPKRRVKAKLREDRQTAIGPNDVWAMDFVHDQLATGKKLRVLTVVSHVMCRCLIRVTAIVAKTWCRHWSGYAGKSAIRGRSASIRGRSLCLAISTYGPMPRASPWTSHVRESPRTTPSSKPSTAASGRNA